MADITNYPEMTDELLQRYIAQAMQQAMKPPDSNEALRSGLLAAGLGMMAGSRGRSFGEALGQGGLLGLQAYGGAKEAQRKDPMQMINLLTAVQGLRTNQEKQQWLKDFPGGMGAPAQYAPQSDFAPGEAPGPVTPPMTPQMVAPPVAGQAIPMPKLMRGMALDIPLAKTLYEGYGKAPSKLGPGEIPQNFNPLTGQWEQGQPAPNLDRGMRMGPQGVQMEPGYAKTLAEITQAQKDAEEAAKAKRDVITVTEGGRPRPVSREQWLTEQQQKPGVPVDIQTMWADYLKSGGPEKGLPFKMEYMPKPQQAALNPTEAEKAVAVQQATMPGEMNKAMVEGLGKYSIENFATGHKAAEEAAYNQLPAIHEVRKRISGGAFTGGGAETKTEALNFLNGWLGTSIASAQIAQSQALKSALGYQVLANAKKLGANPTEADARRIDDIVGKQGLSQEALLTIAEVQEKLANQIITRHNQRLDNMESVYKERGIPTDTITGLRVKLPEMAVESKKPQGPQGATTLQLKAIEDEILRRRGAR